VTIGLPTLTLPPLSLLYPRLAPRPLGAVNTVPRRRLGRRGGAESGEADGNLRVREKPKRVSAVRTALYWGEGG
jgi:hypothetical protein